jgi:hypothetical protein
VAQWLGDPLPGQLPAHSYLALHSIHPDEHKILEPLANMDPGRLDFNPRHFDHPTFHIYLVGATLGAAHVAGLTELSAAPRFYLENPGHMARVYLVGRLLTVLFGAALLVVTGSLGARVAGPVGSWLAPLCLLASAPFVVHCHYLTTDLPLTFWMASSAAAALTARGRKGLWWSTVLAGLSAATKYYGLIALAFPLYGVYDRRSDFARPLRTASAMVGVAVGILLVTSPYMVIAPRQFIATGFDVWRQAIQHREASTELYLYPKLTPPGWLQYAGRVIPQSMGLPLALTAVAGLAAALVRRRGPVIYLLAGAVPYFLLIGAMPFHLVKHSLPLLPFLAVGAAALAGTSQGRWRTVAWVLLVPAMGHALLHCVNHVWVLRAEDTRILAGRWLHRNVPDRMPVARPWEASAFSVPADPGRRTVVAFCPILEGLRLDRLDPDRPPVFAATELEYRQYLRLKQLYPDEAAFFESLLQGGTPYADVAYRTVTFAPRGLLPYPALRPGFPPHDWIFVSPRTMLLIPSDHRLPGEDRRRSRGGPADPPPVKP